jgi:hypothetical protein
MNENIVTSYICIIIKHLSHTNITRVFIVFENSISSVRIIQHLTRNDMMSDRKNVMGGAWPMLWHQAESNAQIHVHLYIQSRKTARFWKQFDKLKNYEDIARSATSRKEKKNMQALTSLSQFSFYLLIHVQESWCQHFNNATMKENIVTNTK